MLLGFVVADRMRKLTSQWQCQQYGHPCEKFDRAHLSHISQLLLVDDVVLASRTAREIRIMANQLQATFRTVGLHLNFKNTLFHTTKIFDGPKLTFNGVTHKPWETKCLNFSAPRLFAQAKRDQPLQF